MIGCYFRVWLWFNWLEGVCWWCLRWCWFELDGEGLFVEICVCWVLFGCGLCVGCFDLVFGQWEGFEVGFGVDVVDGVEVVVICFLVVGLVCGVGGVYLGIVVVGDEVVVLWQLLVGQGFGEVEFVGFGGCDEEGFVDW